MSLYRPSTGEFSASCENNDDDEVVAKSSRIIDATIVGLPSCTLLVDRWLPTRDPVALAGAAVVPPPPPNRPRPPAGDVLLEVDLCRSAGGGGNIPPTWESDHPPKLSFEEREPESSLSSDNLPNRPRLLFLLRTSLMGVISCGMKVFRASEETAVTIELRLFRAHDDEVVVVVLVVVVVACATSGSVGTRGRGDDAAAAASGTWSTSGVTSVSAVAAA